MKILVLATKPPSVQNGAGLRLVNVASHLRARHRFELLCYARRGQALEPEAAAVFARTALLPFPEDPPRNFVARAASLLSASHFMPSDAAMREAVRAELARERCDLVLDVGGLMLRNLPQGGAPAVVVDSIDEPSLTYERALRHAPLSRKPRLWRTLWLYRRIDREIGARADVNVYASDVDAARFASGFPSARVAAIPNGVDAEHFRPGSAAPERDLVAFEGNLSFEPNVDAAERLCREILPKMWSARPALRAVLVGRDPDPRVRALASERVTVTGTVPDVREHLRRASAFACPMRLGAGIKNKLLQAWALGIPIVSSSQALGGLEAKDGENVLIADEPQRFAARLGELLDSEDLRRTLAANGRALVLEKYTWRAQAERFERLFAEVASKVTR